MADDVASTSCGSPSWSFQAGQSANLKDCPTQLIELPELGHAGWVRMAEAHVTKLIGAKP
jgi:hypothetical protein